MIRITILSKRLNVLCDRNHVDDGCNEKLNWEKCTILNIKK